MKAYYISVSIVAVCALVGMAAPTLIIGLMFTVVGIPLAFILAAAPAVAAILFPAALLQATVFQAIPRVRDATRGGLGVHLSVGAAFALNAAVALVGGKAALPILSALSRNIARRTSH